MNNNVSAISRLKQRCWIAPSKIESSSSSSGNGGGKGASNSLIPSFTISSTSDVNILGSPERKKGMRRYILKKKEKEREREEKRFIYSHQLTTDNPLPHLSAMF